MSKANTTIVTGASAGIGGVYADRLARRGHDLLPGATRAELWGKAGVDVAAIPADRLMNVGDVVDAALVGLDIGEAATIPFLPDTAVWSRLNDARLAMGPNLSLARAARRSHRAGEGA